MKYFKTKGERIYLAISIGIIFWFDSFCLINKHSHYDFKETAALMFIASVSPFVLYTMYKLIFKKEEKEQ